jgi:hypothetical protein
MSRVGPQCGYLHIRRRHSSPCVSFASVPCPQACILLSSVFGPAIWVWVCTVPICGMILVSYGPSVGQSRYGHTCPKLQIGAAARYGKIYYAANNGNGRPTCAAIVLRDSDAHIVTDDLARELCKGLESLREVLAVANCVDVREC